MSTTPVSNFLPLTSDTSNSPVSPADVKPPMETTTSPSPVTKYIPLTSSTNNISAPPNTGPFPIPAQDKELSSLYQKIRRLIFAAGLHPDTRNTVMGILEAVFEAKVLNEYPRDVILVCVIVCTCRMTGSPLTLREACEVTGCDRGEVEKAMGVFRGWVAKEGVLGVERVEWLDGDGGDGAVEEK